MPTLEPLSPSKLATVVCRPALPRDTQDVMELTSRIWEGEDYVPYVWQEWLSEPVGLLSVAEYGGRVVGLGKLSRLAPGQWWLQGLRVHPEFSGRRIASHLHEFQLDYWQRHGEGVIRLATVSHRPQIHHLSERTGFQKVVELSDYRAPAIAGEEHAFHPFNPDEVEAALNLARASPALSLSSGLIDLGWQWAAPHEELLSRTIEQGRAWWWGEKQGLLFLLEDHEEEHLTPLIQLLACPLDLIAACLLDYRRLAAQINYLHARWTAPLHPTLAPLLVSAGFQRDWEDSLYIYEKQHGEQMRKDIESRP